MEIYCCECKNNVVPRLTNGKEVYPHRYDLYHLPFWICDKCSNFVGCHHKTKQRTKPLGFIANKEIKLSRTHIHKLIDPIWKKGRISRKELYEKISESVGYRFHTGEIKSIDQAREIYLSCMEIIKSQLKNPLDRVDQEG